MPELNKVQEAELSIFKDVAELCKKRNFIFYALGGTLLGAVRHNGFIPWDDDIDIAIPRPQYDEFLEVARDELSSKYDVVTYHNAGPEWIPRYFCQIHDRSVKIDLMMSNEIEHTTAWMDVFPLDAMPTNRIARELHKVRLLKALIDIKLSDMDRSLHMTKKRPWYEKAFITFAQRTRLGAQKSPQEQIAQAERIACKYLYEDEDWLINYFGAYRFKEVFPKSWFGQGVELPFEDTTIICPVEYDRVLTQMYGAYMTPPPESERGARHESVIVGDNDCFRQEEGLHS